MQKFFYSLLAFFFVLTSLVSHAGGAITITYGNKYKPFAWEKNDVARGVQVEFVEEILGKKMGLKVNHEPYPWKRCQVMVKNGEKDGFFTVPTPLRSEYTLKSRIPFYETHFVMHMSKNNPKISKLRNVKSLKDLERMPEIMHVHMLGSGWHTSALENMKSVSAIPDASLIPLFLVMQRADVYIEQDEMFRFQVKSLGLSDKILTLKEPVIRRLGWHIFISKKSKYCALIPKINETLESLRETGELEKIKQRLFLRHGIE